MNHGCAQSLRCVVVVLAIGSLVGPEVAVGSPARRLARRGVVVGPPAAIVVPAPAAVPPMPVPAPPWAWRRFGPPGVVVLPPFPGLVPPPAVIVERVAPAAPERASPGIASSPAPAPSSAPAPTPAPAPAPPSGVTPPAGGPSASVPQTARIAPPADAAQPPGQKPVAGGGVEEIPAPRPSATNAAASTAAASTTGAATAFSSAWHARHPEAWKPARLSASPWKVADVATVTAWIGQPVVRADGSAGAGKVAPASAQAPVQPGSAPDGDGLRSVLVLPSGQGEDGDAADEWLPLGVFAVAPPGGAAGHNYQQLAVDRSGAIKGTFYDAISDTVLPITGTVDKGSLRATWTVGANGSRFEAAVAAFSAAPGTVAVTSGGATRELELVPIDAP